MSNTVHIFPVRRIPILIPHRIFSSSGYEHHIHRDCNVSFYNNNLRVTVTKRAIDVDRWIRKQVYMHRHMLDKLIVGLDVEWLPNFNPEDNHPVATLQLCIGYGCLIFQLLHKDFIPPSLYAFLLNQAFTFVGIGIQDDVEKLRLHHGLIVSNTMDLNTLASLVKNDSKFEHMGLKRMANEILQKVMPKPKHVTLSHWDAECLNREQIEYACIDAFVSFELGVVLQSELNLITSP